MSKHGSFRVAGVGPLRFLPIILASALLFALSFYNPRHYQLCSDAVVYIAAQELFLNGGNPYSHNQILGTIESLGCKLNNDIWNPPPLFTVLAPILAYSPSTNLLFLSLLQVVAALVIGWCGWRLSRGGVGSFVPGVFIAILTSAPWWMERLTGQISSLLSAIFMLGLFFFLSQRYFLSGILLSIAIIKPHLFFLPLAGVVFLSLSHGKRSTLIGLGTGVTLGFGIAEFWHPGIISAWLNRESWPTDIMGSSLPALIREQVFVQLNYDPGRLTLVIPILAVVFLASYFRYRPPANPQILLFSLIVLNPLATPYGFIFDMTSLILPVAYMLSSTWEDTDKQALYRLVFAGSGITCALCLALSSSGNGKGLWPHMPSHLWWYFPQVGTLLMWFIYCHLNKIGETPKIKV